MTNIVLAGGGTAGHVNPLLSVADAIKKLEPDAKLSVIGTAVGLEHDLVPQAGYELDTVEKVPFPRRPNKDAITFPWRWSREKRKVRAILERRGAQVVVGFGGYASAPVYSVAHAMGIPVVIHEQNARAGMANKLGAKWASFIGTAYEHTGLKPGSATTIERVGLPLRPAIARLAANIRTDYPTVRAQAASQLGIDPDRPVVVVTGGSLGALSLNKAVAGAAADLLKRSQVIHLTGKGKIDQVTTDVTATAGADAINDLDPTHAGQGDYHVAQYLERIDLAFACADLVICRAGAGTVCELTALGLPAVYVPLPIGNGEQRFNAQPVVDADGGIIVNYSDFTPEWVCGHVAELLDNPQRLHELGDHAWQYGIRDAADIMARHILNLAKTRG